MMNAAIFLTMMAATSSPAATVTLYAYDEQGQMLDLPAVIARLSRADDKNPDPDKLPFWAFPNESKAVPTRVKLSKKEKLDLEYRIDENTANGPFVAFESSSEKIRNFLETHGKDVFTEKPIEFQRIDL
jgi:hypothetical protein